MYRERLKPAEFNSSKKAEEKISLNIFTNSYQISCKVDSRITFILLFRQILSYYAPPEEKPD